MQDWGSSGPLCDHGVSPEQRGRGCRTQQSDSSGDVREMLLLRISLAIKLRVQVNAGNLCGNKPPYPLPGKVAFRAGISAAGGGGGLPKPISKQREKNRRQTPSVRAQPWGLQCKRDAMAGAVFLFGKLPPPGCIDSQM